MTGLAAFVVVVLLMMLVVQIQCISSMILLRRCQEATEVLIPSRSLSMNARGATAPLSAGFLAGAESGEGGIDGAWDVKCGLSDSFLDLRRGTIGLAVGAVCRDRSDAEMSVD
jgi:hypothetical protein